MDELQSELLSLTSKEYPQTFIPIYSPNNTGNIQVKVTRLDENYLGDLKRKRKLSTDSLESLDDLEKTNYLQNVEQYLSDTGINVQLIAKNDKKLVKLNLNKPSSNLKDSIDRIKSVINLDYNQNSRNLNKSLNLDDIDDLPSESDVSSGVVIIPTNNSIQNSKLDSNILSQNPLTVCFTCEKCNKVFDDESLFKIHQENVESCDIESELDKFLLSEFNNQISHEKEEEKIQNSKLNRKKTFVCTECGIQFYTQNDLNKHMLQTHESSKPFQCSQCPMTFLELSTKNRHEKEHLGLKPFRCYICAFEFTRASNLRTHLLKVHPGDIGTLVNINKSVDNKLKFEFDLEAIRIQKEQGKIPRNYGSPSKTSESTNTVPNTIIYIKDPNNKNSDIQHMVVYVDGKPIFVQNPKSKESEITDSSKDAQVPKASINSKSNSRQSKSKTHSTSLNKPVAKIPFLLAAAAAAAASNHRKHQQIMTPPHIPEPTSLHLSSDECIRPASYDHTSAQSYKPKEFKHDQEYLQLVSMFKQKNEKLYNPLKTF
ncbi:unnamed protein product [Brachionus calyciflorus]|uniref:C2H2-type domain-containing protein n=1 Tax=Brachionus calyciflorus TaxID=104777 RepID=A0A814ID55_9BILA|nr:unnamed protein product [Brachionus calyciflorus]